MAPDLCDSCLHFTACTRHLLFDAPVVYCDNYANNKGLPKDSVCPELRGLCKSCSKRYICSRLKPASGVWHCEEYQ